MQFLSTLSLRRATLLLALLICPPRISIHALLAESDKREAKANEDRYKFLSTLSLRRATPTAGRDDKDNIFLSTLSLRRATASVLAVSRARYFYPRSPCGERRSGFRYTRRFCAISIHALLAESDHLFASSGVDFAISIHALLAESDPSAMLSNGKE